MAAVQLSGIFKRYGDTQVVHGIDLDIDDGEFVVLVGPSGCGKSTLMRMVAGLEEISGGDLMIGGTRANGLAPHRATRRRNEHAFGVTRREALTAPGTARLEQHRRALRRRLREVIAVDVVITSRVLHAMHFCRVREHARGLVAQHGAVFPAAFPELVEHFEVLVGAIVALVVRQLFREAYRACRAV